MTTIDDIAARPCVTHHHACDCREAAHAAEITKLAAALADAANALDRYASHPDFVLCLMCNGIEGDVEEEIAHKPDCLVSRCRALAQSPEDGKQASALSASRKDGTS